MIGIVSAKEVVFIPLINLEHLLKRVRTALDRVGKSKNPVAVTVHRLRVACRRAQVGLLLSRKWLPRKRRKKLQKCLGKVRRSADLTRNMDVLLRTLAKSKPGTPRRIWLLAVKKDRSKAVKKLCHDVRNLKDSLDFKVRALIKRLREESSSRIHQQIRERVSALLTRVNGSIGSAGLGETAFHQFRVASKKARYGLEMSRSLWPAREVKTMIGFLEEIQDRMGDVNDQVGAVRDLESRIKETPRGPWRELLRRERNKKALAWKAVVEWLETIRGPMISGLDHLQAEVWERRGVTHETITSVAKLKGIDTIPGFENGIGACVGASP